MAGLIQDIVVREKSVKTKSSPVKEVIAKLHLPHIKPVAKKPARHDAELVDIIMRFRTRK
jgi:hypothetical protein